MADKTEINRVKADRRLLEDALLAASAKIKGNSVTCPFHPDTHASGSIHGKDGSWFFSCHACNWNDGKRSGDVVAVVQRHRGISFTEACAILGITDSRNHERNGVELSGKRPKNATKAPRRDPDIADIQKALGAGIDAHERLLNDPEALQHLFTTRAIDRATAEQFKLGITGKPGSRYWTLPIYEDEHFVGLKLHRADGQQPKCKWQPKGVSSVHLWPVALDFAGPVWLCPGELKALSVISAGRSAIGVTGGENAPLPCHSVELVRGRCVAVPADRDSTGTKWADSSIRMLVNEGIDARAVNFSEPLR